MLTKRIIACLDVQDGRTVKGIQFENLRDAGDPVELGGKYSAHGIDELVFLDIRATLESRSLFFPLVSEISKHLSIPFTVGGGISSIDEVEKLLSAGADKVSLNSSAVRDPELITQLAHRFGSQCVVVAIDSRNIEDVDTVFVCAGKIKTEHQTIPWAREVVERGAGEILLTSMDHDGCRAGFAVELTKRASESVSIPVVASGGGGNAMHFKEVLTIGNADAALAAGIFHEGVMGIQELKQELRVQGVWVR